MADDEARLRIDFPDRLGGAGGEGELVRMIKSTIGEHGYSVVTAKSNVSSLIVVLSKGVEATRSLLTAIGQTIRDWAKAHADAGKGNQAVVDFRFSRTKSDGSKESMTLKATTADPDRITDQLLDFVGRDHP